MSNIKELKAANIYGRRIVSLVRKEDKVDEAAAAQYRADYEEWGGEDWNAPYFFDNEYGLLQEGEEREGGEKEEEEEEEEAEEEEQQQPEGGAEEEEEDPFEFKLLGIKRIRDDHQNGPDEDKAHDMALFLIRYWGKGESDDEIVENILKNAPENLIKKWEEVIPDYSWGIYEEGYLEGFLRCYLKEFLIRRRKKEAKKEKMKKKMAKNAKNFYNKLIN